jgi:hypothetical protein
LHARSSPRQGPRLLYRFLQDWVTQVTIGLFMGTFIYVCLCFLVTHQDALSLAKNPSGPMYQLDRPQRLLWARAFQATRIPDHRRVVSMFSVPGNFAVG